MAKRIQRKRARGWRMPEGAVYVGRPSKWGNHVCSLMNNMTRPWAVTLFREWTQQVATPDWFRAVRTELRGKDLACWCPLVDQHGNAVPCHADVLLELANTPTTGGAG